MMSGKSILQLIFISCVFAALTAGTALAQGTGFNFQGRLNDGANPANGSYDLQFRLYDAIAGGTQIGAVVSRPNTTLINGVFSTTLDFGATAFNNPNSVFIEIAIKPNGSPNAYTILGPRQQLTVVPFAVRSANATNADNATNAQNSVNSQNSVNATNATNSLSLGGVAAGNYLQTNGNGSQLTNVNAVTATTATTADNALSLGGVAANGYARLNVSNTGDLITEGRLQISGNATQFPTANGLVKASALVRVVRDCPIGQPFCTTLTPSIVRCYNSVTNSTSVPCGFALSNATETSVSVNFGFQTSNRFISLTSGPGATGAAVLGNLGQSVNVLNGDRVTSEFYIFIF